MNKFITHFVREHDGKWSCVTRANLYVDQGRVQITPGTRLAPGTLFMGVDIVGLLEEELGRQKLVKIPAHLPFFRVLD